MTSWVLTWLPLAPTLCRGARLKHSRATQHDHPLCLFVPWLCQHVTPVNVLAMFAYTHNARVDNALLAQASSRQRLGVHVGEHVPTWRRQHARDCRWLARHHIMLGDRACAGARQARSGVATGPPPPRMVAGKRATLLINAHACQLRGCACFTRVAVLATVVVPGSRSKGWATSP